MDWFYANAVGGIKLIIPQTYYDQALAILADDHSDEMNHLTDTAISVNEWEWSDPDEATDDFTEPTEIDVACPFCTSHDVEVTAKIKKKSWISFFTLGFVPPPTQNSYLCHICLNKWNETEAIF